MLQIQKNISPYLLLHNGVQLSPRDFSLGRQAF